MFDQCQGEVRIGILTGQEYRGFRALGYFEVIAVRAPCRGTVQGVIPPILKQAENGVPVPELCREHGMSSASFYKWRAKFGGMDASMMARLKELEDENRRLKKMYAEERLKADILKEAIEKKW